MSDNKHDKKEESKLEEEIKHEQKEILKELEDLKSMLSDKEDSYKRALADYINLKRRSEEEKIAVVKFANEVLLEKFIGIFIDLEEAKKHMVQFGHPELLDGLSKVLDKFLKVLKDEGIELIDPKGELFAPLEMEAIESLPGEKDVVVKVYRKGFKLNGKVIITAMVAVGNGN